MNLPSRPLALTALLCVVVSAPCAIGQEKPRLSPEVIAILGEPDPPETGLDAGVIAVLGQPEEAVPAGESALYEKSAAIAVKLRCPVCQGVAVSDSPSGMAVKMRGQIRDLVAQGYSEDQVLSYFERSYGEFVRLEPPMQGLNLLLWIAPGALLLGGTALVLHKARQKAPITAADAPANPAPPAVDPALAKYLDRIRRDSGTSS